MHKSWFLSTVLSVTLWNLTHAIIREYFVGVVEREWDYAPKGNLLREDDNNRSDIYLENNPEAPSIGTKYIKAFYREFTDKTFTVEKQNPEWMGVVGIFIKGEIGDHLVVHFKNMVTLNHSYSMHPHGVFYNKDSEGALYVDGSSGANKNDDHVPPGGEHTYVWIVHPDYGPTDSDPSCITWLVHSHQFAEEEVMTGTVGVIVTCKKGSLDEQGNRLDVHREYVLLFMIFDENHSLYRNQNIRTYLPTVTDDQIVQNFAVFQRSNYKFSINGYIYGNLPGLTSCLGETVNFHIVVVGNDESVHSIYMQGHNMIAYHQRMDTIGLYPGSSISANVTTNNPGRWLVSSQSVLQIEAGMQAFFTVNKSCQAKHPTSYGRGRWSGNIRSYYIAAEEVWWQYAPSGRDIISNTPLAEHPIANASFGESNGNNCKLNGKYKKAIFTGYRDGSFHRRSNIESHLGFLGPPIKAEVGDTVEITFFNKASRNYSIQAYRFFATYKENGIQYDGGPEVAVPPQGKRVYTWSVPPTNGPTEYDPPCLYGRYYSSVDPVRDTYTGLSGPLIVCKKGTLDSHGKNRHLDREFYLAFSDVLEFENHYFQESVTTACPGMNFETLSMDNNFRQANVMRSLNGRAFGNLAGLTMCQGDSVNWYMTSVGSGMDDIHSPHFHGNNIMVNGLSKDTYTLIPDLFVTAFMKPDNVGNWSLEDQVTLFVESIAQMEFIYQVRGDCGRPRFDTRPSGVTRTYYIAAVEMEWDYAPVNQHIITGELLSEDRISQQYYNNDPERNMVGHKYIKALYREFTDGSFTTQKERDYFDSHLGILGPFIRAEVGDTVRVVFKNMASFPFSIMPHGLFYNKSEEGYRYNDGVPNSEKQGAAVGPGKTFTYEWFVPKSAGPGYDDFNCVTWAYLSHVDYTRDLNTALMGPLIVCRPGILNENGRRWDVDREWALLFFIANENDTPYRDQNIRTYLGKEPTPEVINDMVFFQSNAKLGINGYIFGNVPNVTMLLGQKTAISLLNFGDTTSTHTIHFHGNTEIRRLTGPHRHDVFDVLPGDFTTVEMVGINKGTWLVHCHVNNHSENGMDMVYRVIDPDEVYHTTILPNQ